MALIKINKNIPLMGTIMFGLIDRGSNLIQIRPTTICNLKCLFCSTSANDHPNNYQIDLEHLIQEIKKLIKLKECNNIQADIDSVGEALCYPKVIELIKELKKIKEVKFIFMQSNGTLLNKRIIQELEQAGLNRINLSLHSLNENTSRHLTQNKTYNQKKVLENIKELQNSKIELLITPVYLPSINEQDMEELIQFCKKNNYKIILQKYETYKYSRKMKKAKRISWWKFYKYLEQLEEKYNTKLKYGPIDFKILRTKKLPLTFERNETLYATVKLPGWFKDQMIATAKGKCITILNCNNKINDKIKIKILENKNNIYIANKI